MHLMKSETINYAVSGIALVIILAVSTVSEAGSIVPNQTETPVKPVQKTIVCLDCHRSPNINTNEGVHASRAFCFDCHQEKTCGKTIGKTRVPLQVTPETFDNNPHRFFACIQCHQDVARSPHKTDTGARCLDCHTPHGESIAHEPHIRVACQACHFESKYVALDPADGRVKLAHINETSTPISLADHNIADTSNRKSCEKCHHDKNRVGAPASVLPAKGALCIVCHNSPLAMGHPVFGVASLIFLVGILLTLRFWYQGSVQGEKKSLTRKIGLSAEAVWSTIFSKQFFSLATVFILDVVLQRRLLKESVQRWSMHALIFSAILMRFMLSVFTGLLSFFNPGSPWAMVLIDKNSGFTAVTNDLLGLLIFAGIGWALIQRFFIKPKHVVTETQDTIALIIIGALVSLGFILEGARILVTGIAADMAAYSFVGFFVANILSLAIRDWASLYPSLWYAHGLTGALLVAYLPFGKMRHIFNTPLTYFLEEISGVKNKNRV